jgi:hypothetical protein
MIASVRPHSGQVTRDVPFAIRNTRTDSDPERSARKAGKRRQALDDGHPSAGGSPPGPVAR